MCRLLWSLCLGCQEVYIADNFVITYSAYPEKMLQKHVFLRISVHLKSNRLYFVTVGLTFEALFKKKGFVFPRNNVLFIR